MAPERPKVHNIEDACGCTRKSTCITDKCPCHERKADCKASCLCRPKMCKNRALEDTLGTLEEDTALLVHEIDHEIELVSLQIEVIDCKDRDLAAIYEQMGVEREKVRKKYHNEMLAALSEKISLEAQLAKLSNQAVQKNDKTNLVCDGNIQVFEKLKDEIKLRTEELKENEETIGRLADEFMQIASDKKTLEQECKALKQKLEGANQELAVLKSTLASRNSEIAALQNNLKELEELREMKEVTASRLRALLADMESL